MEELEPAAIGAVGGQHIKRAVEYAVPMGRVVEMLLLQEPEPAAAAAAGGPMVFRIHTQCDLLPEPFGRSASPRRSARRQRSFWSRASISLAQSLHESW